MTELTYHHRYHLGEALLRADDDAFRDAVVPADTTPDIAAFAAELSPLPPQHIPRIEDDDANYGWPAESVRAKIERDGGDIRFGWRLREWPGVLLTADFHAVWVDPQGALIDITPDVPEGDTSLFLPLPTDAPAAETAQKPPPRYRITHTRPDMSAELAARIARMKPGQRTYEEKRAGKAGKTLQEWLNDKFHPDPLQNLITRFIAACQAFDANLPTLPELVAAEIARIERDLVAGSEQREADDVAAIAAPSHTPIEAEDAAGPPPEPGSPPTAEGDAPADMSADNADDDDVDSEQDKAYDEVWDAIDTIEIWSESRRLCRNAIAVLLPEP